MTAAVLADSSAALKTSPGTSIADRVKAQLQRDYPPGALSWVDDLAWSGPVRVPLAQIDKTSGDTEWSAAAADKLKLQRFQKRIAAGWRKPVVLVRSPGSSRMFAVDGHTRIRSEMVSSSGGQAEAAAVPEAHRGGLAEAGRPGAVARFVQDVRRRRTYQD